MNKYLTIKTKCSRTNWTIVDHIATYTKEVPTEPPPDF